MQLENVHLDCCFHLKYFNNTDPQNTVLNISMGPIFQQAGRSYQLSIEAIKVSISSGEAKKLFLQIN